MMIVGAHNPWAPIEVSVKRGAGPGSGLVYLFLKIVVWGLGLC